MIPGAASGAVCCRLTRRTPRRRRNGEIHERVSKPGSAVCGRGHRERVHLSSGWLTEDRRLEVATTLAYVNEAAGIAADWEPKQGPVCIWHRCGASDADAKPHYIFDYVSDGGLNWTQLAVERYGLQDAFRAGDFRYIFTVLADFCEVDR